MALIVRCEEYFAEVRAFAATRPPAVLASLEDRLKEWRECGCDVILTKDFAPYSFGFAFYRKGATDNDGPSIVGGLIYYGPGNPGSGFDILSTRLDTSREGWEANT